MSTMADLYVRDARQAILVALAGRENLTLSADHLTPAVEKVGCTEPPEWLAQQLYWMQRMGAVALRHEGETLFATLTDAGAQHLHRILLIEGIGRPSLARMGVDLIAKGFKGG